MAKSMGRPGSDQVRRVVFEPSPPQTNTALKAAPPTLALALAMALALALIR
jgi:hypothetical protein